MGVTSGHIGFNLPAMPWSDWEIAASEIQICRRSNGMAWELGSGSFGKASYPLDFQSNARVIGTRLQTL